MVYTVEVSGRFTKRITIEEESMRTAAAVAQVLFEPPITLKEGDFELDGIVVIEGKE